MRKFLMMAFVSLFAVVALSSCGEDEENTKSNACDIVSFKVGNVDWVINGTNITHSYPTETAYGQLTPVIAISPGASVSPASGTAQNFFTDAGVTYTVTAENGETKKTYIAKASIEAVISGTTGSCSWRLTGARGNYTLVISGTGAMEEYVEDKLNDDRPYNMPWYEYLDSITTFIVQEGVTTIGALSLIECSALTSVSISNTVTAIGEAAFDYCEGLTSVIIPNSVITIGEEAFAGCENLVSVTLGNSVEVIEEDAFDNCGLTSITIPNSVTTIGGQAFSGCKFTSVAIPSSVTTIGEYAFGGCSNLTAINVDAANSAYSSVDGVLFNKNQTVLKTYPGGKNGSYTIPNTVTAIEEYAFEDCTGLTSVTIPNSVTAIGECAFFYCTGLTEITCLNPVPPVVDDYAFYGVNNITLKVPANAVAAYHAADVWKNLGTIEAIE